MVSTSDEPLPVEAIRDLLGITRALYASEKARGAGKGELERIARVGQLLTNALDLSGCPVRTVGHGAAWTQAKTATRMLAEIVGPFMGVEPLMKAARKRVRRG